MPATATRCGAQQDTTPDAIEAALRELLVARHAENGGFFPARALNMIAFVDRAWSGEIANRLRGVGRYHASRLVVLSYEPPASASTRAPPSPPKATRDQASSRCCARRWSSRSASATSTTC